MEWLARLKARSIKKALLPSIVLFVAAVAIFFFSGAYGVFGMLAPKTLADLTPETAEGAFVDDEIYFLYGEFIEVEQYKNNRPTGIFTGRYYLTDFDEDTYYMALYVHQEDLKGAESMMDACDDYMDGNLNPNQLPTLHVRGTIRAMDKEELGYYYDIADGDAEFKEVLLPYCLEVGRVNGLSTPLLIIVIVISLVCLGLGLYTLIRACTGGCQKNVRQMLEATGNFEGEVEKAARFYDTTEPINGFRMGREFVYFEHGQVSVLLRPWDVAWAYQSTTRHRTNGIPTGKTYALVLRLMNGKSYNISMSEKKVQELLRTMETAMPGTVLGYTKELERIYNTQRSAFSARWEEKVPGCTGQTQQPTPQPEPQEPQDPASV